MLLHLLVICTMECALGAKILGVFPFPSYSHYILGVKLMEQLAENGHDVTFLTAYKEQNTTYKTIFLENFKKGREKEDWFLIPNRPRLFHRIAIYRWMEDVLHQIFLHPKIRTLIKSNERYDILIVESFYHIALIGLCYKLRAHCVVFNSNELNYVMDDLVKNNRNPIYVHNEIIPMSNHINFWQRSQNVLWSTIHAIIYYSYFIPSQNKLLQQYIIGSPHLYELLHNVTLVLLNTYPGITQAVPRVPNMIEIAGYHISSLQALPADIEKFLNESQQGVIYFSMGSIIKCRAMSTKVKKAIINVFKQIPMDVLWNCDDDLVVSEKNIMITKWVPQHSLLAHPNIQFFITHGGYLSIIEAAYYGVPIIGIPIYDDQFGNVQNGVNRGVAQVINYYDISEESFSKCIKDFIHNINFYSTNAKKLSKIIHDRPLKPIQMAIYWIEYVIRHDGARHLRTAAMDLRWYQIFGMDIAVILIIAICISYLLVRKGFTRMCRKNTKKSSLALSRKSKKRQ